MYRFHKIVLIMSLVLIMAMGCAPKATQYSGFLKDYPQFVEGKAGVDKVYEKKGVNFKKYNKIMLDHVVFYFKPDAEYKGIQTEELNTLAEAFHKAMADALKDAYPLVEKPGSDVMRIRTAITDLVPSNPALSGITTVVPIGLAISAITSGAGGGHTGVGEASIEIEILDSTTNERLAVGVDTKPGSKLSGLSKWGAANEAFEFWAKRLRASIDEIHGR